MAVYVNHQSVYDAVLREYKEKGFRLEEDDDIVTLYYKDELVARFANKGATIETIRETCQLWLEKVGE